VAIEQPLKRILTKAVSISLYYVVEHVYGYLYTVINIMDVVSKKLVSMDVIEYYLHIIVGTMFHVSRLFLEYI
jgi:hypothetical protein